MLGQIQLKGLAVSPFGNSLVRTEVKHLSLGCAWLKQLVIGRPDRLGRNCLFREVELIR